MHIFPGHSNTRYDQKDEQYLGMGWEAGYLWKNKQFRKYGLKVYNWIQYEANLKTVTLIICLCQKHT